MEVLACAAHFALIKGIRYTYVYMCTPRGVLGRAAGHRALAREFLVFPPTMTQNCEAEISIRWVMVRFGQLCVALLGCCALVVVTAAPDIQHVVVLVMENR
jgi:hypothetical protein